MKAQIRKQIHHAMRSLGQQALEHKSSAACKRLVELPEFRSARTVMVYLEIPHELVTADLVKAAIAAGKTLVSPVVDPQRKIFHAAILKNVDSDLFISIYGIREPMHSPVWPAENIDFIVVPAVAFDVHGNRLGRGGGYYDKFLSQPDVHAFKCGLALEEQLLPDVPTHDHDVPVDAVVTDTRTLRFK